MSQSAAPVGGTEKSKFHDDLSRRNPTKMPLVVERGLAKKSISTTPGMSLAEVMIAACEQFGADPARCVLRLVLHKGGDLSFLTSCRFVSEIALGKLIVVSLQLQEERP